MLAQNTEFTDWILSIGLGPKSLGPAQYVNQCLVWRKNIGPAQTILEPVEGQGISNTLFKMKQNGSELLFYLNV